MGLRTYNQKRNFKVTAEPPGKLAKSKTGHHYFIQKHDASHLHFDFRLELDGVLKSWAVPKGPSITPGLRRLAVEVEDHPLSYGDFEGTIPGGEYGGGTVMLWDRGSWEPEGDARKALKAGKLSFELKGDRLKGHWTLVRTKSGEKGKNLWFLIKRTDKGAAKKKEPVEAFTTSVSSERKMTEIAKGEKVWHSNKGKEKTVKPPKKSVKKTKSTLPKNFKPELATLVDHPPEGDEWLHEIKFDGYRIIALIKNGAVKLFTRSGLDWTDKLKDVARSISDLNFDDCILDGELIAADSEGRSNFQALQNSLKDNSIGNLVYYVFDLPSVKEPLLDRKKVLAQMFKNIDSDQVKISDFIQGNGDKMFAEASRLGLEGIVSKKIDSDYYPGRSESWLKIKTSKRQEFVIVGYSRPGGSREHFGALLLAARNKDNKLQYVGRTGTGFNAKTLTVLKAQFDKIEVDKRPDIYDPHKEIGPTKDITWLKPKLVAEVKFATWTNHRILRQSVFMGLRKDKPATDVYFETEKKVKQVEHPLISKADKVLFTPNITKQDLVDYYISVQKVFLPHVVNRPLAILRCPDGNEKFCFFQKHAKETPNLKGGKEFVYVDSLDGVIGLVQLGVLEIHAWGTHVKNLEKPDIIVFDLDPNPNVKWQNVVQTAIRIRDRLKLLKLKSFVKTTGGKGLHVVVPIVPEQNWDSIKSFCKSFATALESEFPDEYTSNMSKQKRDKKIFIDYLRNGRGATAVAPYSTRAKAHAPVSAPLSWAELEDVPSADFYTVRNMDDRLKKPDPWKDFFKTKQRLPKI